MPSPTYHPVLAAGLSSVLLLSLSGCNQSTGPSAPVPGDPAGDPQLTTLIHTLTPTLATGQAPLGFYDFLLDPASGTAELLPVRTASNITVGSNIATDVTQALNSATFGCPSCFRITGLSRQIIDSQTVLELSLEVRHPFQAPSLPSSRADLHINNVRLVLMTSGSQSFFGTGGDQAVSGNTALVRNADGYLALPESFVPRPAGVTGNLFPFKVFETGDNLTNPTGNFNPVSGWSGVLATPTGFNVLAMGASATTTIQLRLAGEQTQQVGGRIALLSNFVVSAANRSQRPTPTYYLPEGAMLEPWRVIVDPLPPFVGAGAENAELTIRVTDWQAAAAVDPSFPEPTNPGGLKADSEVSAVIVDIPGFGTGPFGPVGSPDSGTGTPADPWVFTVDITKPAATQPGSYPMLVKVRDSRPGQDALDSSLSVGTGLSSLTELATYQARTLTVGSGGDTPPSCGGFTSNPPLIGSQVTVQPGNPVTLSFDGTNDDVGITLVEVDWDYDGTFASPLDPTYDSTASLGDLSFIYPAIGLNTVALRFTDTIGQTNDPNACTFTVVVSSTNQPPACGGFLVNSLPPGPVTVAAGCQVTLLFDWTNDPDGQVEYVDIDWDYDGVTFTVDDTLFEINVDDSISRVFTSSAVIALRFTDNLGLSNDPATCTVPVTVTGGLGASAIMPLPGSSLVNPDPRIQANVHRNPVTSHDDNVYLYYRQGGTPFNSYIVRSADGGATWGTPLSVGTLVNSAPGGFGNMNGASIQATATGQILLMGVEAGGPFAYNFNRFVPSGVNGLTHDAGPIRLSNGGPAGDPFPAGFHADPSIACDPTDPTIAYLIATGTSGASTSGRIPLVRVNNASTGAPTFTGLGDFFNFSASNFEPLVVAQPNGDLHAVTKRGTTNQLHYRKWTKASSTFGTEQTLTMISGNPFNPYLGVGNDALPVISYDLSSSVYLIKATNPAVPTFTGSVPVLASEVSTGNQIRPFLQVDRLTSNIFLTYADSRYPPAESQATRPAVTLSGWNASLTDRILCDIKVDGPGLGDNPDNFGDTLLLLTQNGAPSAARLLVFWLDGDQAPGPDNILYRRYQ